jgi:hypothetical protein
MINKHCISIHAENCVWASLSSRTIDPDAAAVKLGLEVWDLASKTFNDDEPRDVQYNSVIDSNYTAHLDSSEPIIKSAALQVFEWNKIAEKELLSANVDGARKALGFALKLIEEISVDHPLLVATTFTNLGISHCHMRAFEKALRCFEKVVDCSEGCHLNALLHLKFCTAYSGMSLEFSGKSSLEIKLSVFWLFF